MDVSIFLKALYPAVKMIESTELQISVENQ